MEFIAQLRVASIMPLAVLIPTWWLASNTHKFNHQSWGEYSIGQAVFVAFGVLQDSKRSEANVGLEVCHEDF